MTEQTGNKRIIILGGGISGLSAAWRLSSNNIKVDVLESNTCFGGLSQTFREGPYCVDYGPHSFFSEDEGIIDTVLKLFDNQLQPQPRKVKFYYKGKYLDYPLTAQGVLLQMGPWSGFRAASSFLKSKIFSRKRCKCEGEDATVEDWAIANFGEHLYRTFFKPYTEQFWKMPCSELSASSVPTHTRMNFTNTLRLLLHKKISRTGESLVERESLPTYYPARGFGEIAEKIAAKITDRGGNIQLGCKVVSVSELANGRMRVVYGDKEHKAIDGDYVISTIPLSLLVRMLKPQPAADVLASTDKLDYRALVILAIVTRKQNVLDCGYIYQLNRPYNRITELNKFSPETSPSDENIIMLEIPCLRDSVIWNACKHELLDMCISSLAEDGLLGPGDVKKLFLLKSPCAYPSYRKNYAVHLNRILACIKNYRSLRTLGRCGEYMYMDTDVCMRRAFNLADNLLADLQT